MSNNGLIYRLDEGGDSLEQVDLRIQQGIESVSFIYGKTEDLYIGTKAQTTWTSM